MKDLANGWICPKCKNSISPLKDICPVCKQKKLKESQDNDKELLID